VRDPGPATPPNPEPEGAALAAQRVFLRQILDLNPSFIFAKDREGRFTLVNQAVADAYGTTVEDLLGRTDADFNPNAEEVAHFRADDLEVMDTRREKMVPEERITEAAGQVRWLQTIKRAIVGPDGRATQVLGVATDITQRKLAEERLHSRTERILAYLSALHRLAAMGESDLATALERITEVTARTLRVARVGVWLFNRDRTGIVCDCLHAGGVTTHRPGLVVEQRHYPRYFAALGERRTIAADDAPRDPRTSDLAEGYLLPNGVTSMLDVPIRIRGEIIGVVCHEHTGPARAWAPEEEHFAASISDLVALAIEAARRREVEDELRQAQKMEAIGVLAGGVAHDFNNLLTSILGYCDLTLREPGLSSRIRSNIGEIQRAGHRAAGLTRQLLAFGRKQLLTPQVLDLNEVIAGVEGMLRRIIGEDVRLHARVAPDLWPVRADRSQLEQVLVNLAANARDAMPAGGDLVIATANRDPDPPPAGLYTGPWVVLTVSDTGVGMEAGIRERIFEPFFTTKEVGKGTGMGLASVYGIVRQSGGHVRVESEPGAGTTFHVHLPAVLGAASAEPSGAPSDPGEIACRGETVLLVEDEAQVLELARQVLEAQGYNVLDATDGPAAFELCSDHAGPIDLLITDMVMPEWSGPETCRRLRQIRPGVRVLYMSGYSKEAIADRSGPAPEGVLLEKPFPPGELLRRVRQALNRSSPEVIQAPPAGTQHPHSTRALLDGADPPA
jgi:PAS domain S-box-containing protein